MKNFLYLRVNAIIGIIASFAITFIGLYGVFTETNLELPIWVFLLVFLFLFMVPAAQNFFIIYIYHKHYPAEEIPPLSRTLNTIFNILCLFDLLILIFVLIFEAPNYNFSEYNLLRVWTAIGLMITMAITILIQVTGSFRLIKKVRAGARQQMESSFV